MQVAPPVVTRSPPPPKAPRTYTVQKGDSLYAISRKFYGDSSHIDRIYQANRSIMRSKDNLQVGQTLKIPSLPQN